MRLQLSPVCLQLTVNSVMDFFRTGKGVDLEVLTSATLSKLEEIKEKTAAGQSPLLRAAQKWFPADRAPSAGLSRIIETRKVLDLRIDLKPSYLLIPKSGFYSNTSDLIIVDFGSLQVTLHPAHLNFCPTPNFSSVAAVRLADVSQYS